MPSWISGWLTAIVADPDFLARAVEQFDVALEILRLPRRVVLDAELLQCHGERQILHQIAVGHVQENHVGAGAFRNLHAAAEGRIGRRQTRNRRHLALRNVARLDLLGAQQLLHLEYQVAVHQAADADHHDGRVRQEVPEPVPAAGFGGKQHALLARQVLHLVTLALEIALCAGGERFGRLRRGRLMLVLECIQRLFADVLAKTFHLAREVRCIAVDANAGGSDQEGQDDQKPGGMIDIVQPQLFIGLEPERAELDDVVVVRLGLLQHRPDNGGDGKNGQQADGKTHRAQQLEHGLTEGRGRGIHGGGRNTL